MIDYYEVLEEMKRHRAIMDRAITALEWLIQKGILPSSVQTVEPPPTEDKPCEHVEGKRCTVCGEIKPLEDFHFKVRATGQRMSRCKPCDISHSTAINRAHPERALQYQRRHRQVNRESFNKYMRDYYQANRDRLRAYHRERSRQRKSQSASKITERETENICDQEIVRS